VRRARPLLGPYVEIDVDEEATFGSVESAIEAAFAAVEGVQRLMSFHDSASDLSRINRLAVREPVPVDPRTMAVLRRARRIYQATDGLLDCAVGHELVRWELLPADGMQHVEQGDFSAVELLAGNRVAFTAPVALDLGGIAKGFVVDRAIATLRWHGMRLAVVNAGGDLRVIGDVTHPVHIRDAVNPRRVYPAGLLRDGAIATSSPAATFKKTSGSAVSALVGAASRAPLLDRRTYTVIAPTCVVADALTKILAQVQRVDAPYFERFGAIAIIGPEDRARTMAA
jgi:thiamine biosynthesis lipoprotein